MGTESKTQALGSKPEEVEGIGPESTAPDLDQIFALETSHMQAIKSARYMYLAVLTNNYPGEKWDEYLQSPSGIFLRSADPRLGGRTPLEIINTEVIQKLAEEADKKGPAKSLPTKKKSGSKGDVDWINRENW